MKGEFYKMDYEAWDTGTVDLPLELEAAYLRLCHHMYRNAGPIPDSLKILQGLFRCGHIRAAALRQRLVDAGKIQLTTEGLLTNDRVCRELVARELLSTKRRVAGELGGDRSAITRAKTLNVKSSSEANGSINRTREEEIRGEDTPLVPRGVDPDRFPEFKAVYPRRSTAFPTTAARKRWVEALRKGADPADIITGARNYANEQTRINKIGSEFVKTADSWLHQGRWKDYGTSTETSAVIVQSPLISDVTWRERVQRWLDRRGHWPWGGAPPDEPNTLVPMSVLAEFGLPSTAPPNRIAA